VIIRLIISTMRSTYIIVGIILVLLAGVFVFTSSKDEQVPATTTTVEQQAVPETMVEDDTGNVIFNVSGTNFAFDVTEITVQEGDTVTINFESKDGFHDWVVDEFNASTLQVNPGTVTSVTFVADKAGEYEYYCSVGQHRQMGMVGKLIVETK